MIGALERFAERLPADPEAERALTIDARRADALVALSSQAISDDPDPARARVNLHVDLAALTGRDGSGELEGGGVVHPAVASMLCCDATVQAIIHGEGGHTLGIGRASRNVPPRGGLGRTAGVVYWFKHNYEPFEPCPPGGRDSEPFARRGAAELRRSPEPNRAPPDGGSDSDDFAAYSFASG